MTYLNKLATVFGGAAILAAGCGLDPSAGGGLSQGSAESISAKDSPLVLNNASSNTTDSLVGYYSGCRTKPNNTTWEMKFGRSDNAVNVVVGDSSCQLWATGLKRTVGSTAEVYTLVDPADTSSTKEIQIKASYVASAVAMAMRADNTKAGLVNIFAVDNVASSTVLTYRAEGYKVTVLTGATAASLQDLQKSVTSIGFANVAATSSAEFAPPTYTLDPGDSKIVLDIDNTILTADGSFKLIKATTGTVVPATDVTFGNPGAILAHPATGLELLAGTPPNGATGYYSQLDDASKYQVLRTAFIAFNGYHPATAVLASAANVLIKTADLFPLSTLADVASGNRKNVIIMQRKDTASGVISYQAFTIHLN